MQVYELTRSCRIEQISRSQPLICENKKKLHKAASDIEEAAMRLAGVIEPVCVAHLLLLSRSVTEAQDNL